MFAGPNGSGKSTLKDYLPIELLGVYLNPDEIEKQCRGGLLDLAAFQVKTTEEEVLGFIRGSSFLASAGRSHSGEQVGFKEGELLFPPAVVDSYLSSVVSDFIRQKLLQARISFTFETVMSHPGKVELLRQARKLGFRAYLYYIATEDPAINVSRVRARVITGGHPVPEDKIEARYYRSLELLSHAIRLTNRAYIFDNSEDGREHSFVAEITDGTTVKFKTEIIPAWFQRYVLERMSVEPTSSATI